MGGLGIWEIIFMSLVVAAPFIGVALEKSGKALNRQAYFGWAAGIIAALTIMNVVGGRGINPMLGMAFFVAGLFGLFLLGQKSVQRARDSGTPKNWCYIVSVPMIGLAMVLFLMIRPPVAKTPVS